MGSHRIREFCRTAIGVVMRKGPEWVMTIAFLAMTIGSIVLPYLYTRLSGPSYAPAFSAALSIGTGGLTSVVFYYVMTVRVERNRHRLLREGLATTYAEAKRNIAFAIVHASQKGGRRDLQATFETVDRALTIEGFRQMFEHGSQGDEGFYAFENQMSDRTPEYEEIVFNLKIVARALERIVDAQRIDDVRTYNFFVRTSALIARIERNGPGYDESKPLCALMWEIFAGANWLDGKLGYDPIEQAIAKL